MDGVHIKPMVEVRGGEAAPRETYRHGDLRRALIEAGVALARTGGPEAVVLREATRRVGVVPNAAYRHFANRGDLLLAVREASLAELGGAIARALAALDPDMKRKAYARASLRAVGLAYLAFAAAEPGLFRAAFHRSISLPPARQGDAASWGDKASEPPQFGGRAGHNPFDLLGVALDRMVGAELMPAHRRPGAEFLAWSSVHGLAVLLGEGPLSLLGQAEREEIGERLVRMVERGL